jgi:hypothetical protein
MATKKRRDPHRTSTRPPGRTERRRPAGPLEDLPQHSLLDGVDEALQNPHPLALLTLASSLVAALEPSPHGLVSEPAPGTPTLAELVDSFIDVGYRQTDAVLLVIARLAGDDLMRERIRRSVAERRHPMPGWLLRLDQIEPYRAVMVTHVLGDGDDIIIGVRLPGRHECAIVVYIDHNMGTVVKDAFVLDRPIEDVIDAWSDLDPGREAGLIDMTLADAHVHVDDAVQKGAMTFPPLDSDSWPACRPFLKWIVSMMPDGGAGYVRPEWSEKQLARLTDQFFASEAAASLAGDEDNRSLLESMLWFGTDYGPGDPMRWSPPAVEILLVDWIPRKIAAPIDVLDKVPALLRAFVRYCHVERGIPRELTLQTIAVIDELEPDYRQAIRTPRHQGPMALLERMGLLGDEPIDPFAGFSREDRMLTLLAEEVGGAEALDTLGTEPLPDEAFDWSGIPDDIHERVDEVLTLVDGCADALFDAEFRTAARRVLARVAVGDPEIFRRKGKAATAACAVCWIVAKANDSLDLYGDRGVQAKQLMGHFGLTGSSSQRAEPMLRAIGADWRYGHKSLGSANFLVSTKRDTTIGVRDHLRAKRAASE